ncbi:isocitrate lyase/PEP mutase family protein [Sporosarcina sp. CAU 1771]
MFKNQLIKVKDFHELHKQGPTFILPNAWNAISAKIFEEKGFKAIGTTSAGIAASFGYSDGQKLPFEMMIETISSITRAVNIPVSADIEAGYGFTIDELVNNVREVIIAGAIGINIEDGTGDLIDPLTDVLVQSENIEAIRELSNSLNIPLFINARTDLYWANVGEPEERLLETIHRANAYVEAGADCIFVPGVTDIEAIEILRKEITVPINLLSNPLLPTLEELSTIGIERVSTGSGPFRATVSMLNSIADELYNKGTFEQLTKNVLSYEEVEEMLKK